MGFINESGGVVDASSGAIRTSTVSSYPTAIINAGLIEATGSGQLAVDGIDNSAGRVLFCGNGAIFYLSGTVSGGH